MHIIKCCGTDGIFLRFGAMGAGEGRRQLQVIKWKFIAIFYRPEALLNVIINRMNIEFMMTIQLINDGGYIHKWYLREN